jgi:hypothetical protein
LEEDVEVEEDEDAIRTVVSLTSGTPTVAFTTEELRLINMIKVKRSKIILQMSDAYVDREYTSEMTSILLSKGKVKPSFVFAERMNTHIAKMRYVPAAVD